MRVRAVETLDGLDAFGKIKAGCRLEFLALGVVLLVVFRALAAASRHPVAQRRPSAAATRDQSVEGGFLLILLFSCMPLAQRNT